MSDKKKSMTILQKFDRADVTAKEVIGIVDKYHGGKHGAIKIPHDPKATKVTRRSCAHHVYTPKGKMKNTLTRDGNRLRCTACGEYVNITPNTKEQDERLKKEMFDFYDQLEYLMVEANAADEPITKAIVFSKNHLKKMFKTKKRIVASLAKGQKKKKKHGNKGNSSSTFNSWMRK